MENKKSILIKVSYLVELSEDELIEDDVLDKIKNKLCRNKSLTIDNKEKIIEWIETSSLTLESEEMNCGKCENCGQWVTDKEKEDEIEGLCYGATVKGRLLCDECLPSEHRWAF